MRIVELNRSFKSYYRRVAVDLDRVVAIEESDSEGRALLLLDQYILVKEPYEQVRDMWLGRVKLPQIAPPGGMPVPGTYVSPAGDKYVLTRVKNVDGCWWCYMKRWTPNGVRMEFRTTLAAWLKADMTFLAPEEKAPEVEEVKDGP